MHAIRYLLSAVCCPLHPHLHSSLLFTDARILILGSMPESALKLLKSSLALEADSWCLRKQDFGMPLEEVKAQLAERVEGTLYAGALIGFDSTLGTEAIEHTRTVLKATQAHFTTKRIAIAGSGFVAAAEDGLFPLSFFANQDEELIEFLDKKGYLKA